jgi:copper transport protein
MVRARRLLVPLAVLLALAALAAPAAAHADLMDAEPEPNTELDEAPSELSLDFSEPLEDTYTRVQVLGPNGTDHVDAFRIPADHDDHLAAGLAPLDAGVYTVQWRALSSADGHTTSGSYLLAVDAALGAGEVDDTDPGGSVDSQRAQAASQQVDEGGPGEALLRAAGFLGASLAAGTPLFVLLARGLPVPDRVHRRWEATAAGGAALAALASLGLAGALAGRIELGVSAALATEPGQNLLARAGLFATAGLALGLGARWRDAKVRPALLATGTLAALAGLLVTTLGSHAAAEGVGTGWTIAVDWVHQAAVAFWVAGVVALAVAALAGAPARAAAGLVHRFSPLAVASVAVIVVTGTLSSVDRLTTVGDLWASLYGFALSAKILLLVPLVALGAYHRYHLLPQLDGPETGTSRLRRSAVLELGVMLVVLVAAGFMTTTSPPTPLDQRTPYASVDEARSADTPGPWQPDLDASQLATLTEAEAANVTVQLLQPSSIDELATGSQPVWVLVTDERGPDPEPITDADVDLQAWMPEHGHGTDPETDPTHVHAGMYGGATTWTMEGAWQLRLNVTLPSGDVLHYESTLYVGQQADPLDQRDPLHTAEEDGYALEVFVDPRPIQRGVQNLTVRVTPTEEPALPDNADVVANLDAPSGSGEGESLELERWREDAWTAEEAIFTETGEHSLLVALQGKGTYVQTAVPIPVGDA